MPIIASTPAFLAQVKKLETDLQEEIYERIELFKDRDNHKRLKVHKLHGRLAGCHSFYVNFKVRVVFEFMKKDTALLLAVDDHDAYK